MLRTLAIVLLLSVVALSAHAQSGADVATARDLFKEAAQLSKEGRWEEAKEKLKRSLALKDAPITHYSLAVAQQKTGDIVEALENFRAFLVAPPEPSTDKFRAPAQQAVRQLEPRVARVSLTIRPSQPVGLAVEIDGAEVPSAALDRPRLVNPGAHVVKATAPGYRDASQPFEVNEGGSAEVTLTLTPAPEAPVTPEPTPRGDTTKVAERSFPVAPVVLIVVGAAAIGAGIAVGMVGLNEARDAPTSDGEAADAARTKGIAGDVVTGVGAVAAGIGVILLIVHYAGESDANERSAHVRTDGSTAGVAVSF